MPDGSIVLMGGYDSTNNVKNDIWRSTDEGTTWTEVSASAGWFGKGCSFQRGIPDGSIVLMGGYDTSLLGGHFKNDVLAVNR